MPAQEVDHFLDEIAQCGAAVLISRRNDFDHGDRASQTVLDHHTVCAGGIDLLGGSAHESSDRRRRRRNAAVLAEFGAWPGKALDGQNVRFAWTIPLFNQGRETLRQGSRIERHLDLNRPSLVEVVEQPRRDSRPIVQRHGMSLYFFGTSSAARLWSMAKLSAGNAFTEALQKFTLLGRPSTETGTWTLDLSAAVIIFN